MIGDDREGRIFLPECACRETPSRGGHGVKMAWITQERLDSLYADIANLEKERDAALEGIASGLRAVAAANARAEALRKNCDCGHE